MNGFAIFLVLTSTFFHAGWNLFTRRERSEHTFLLRAIFMVAVLGFVPGIVAYRFITPWPSRVWFCAMLTGVFAGVYFFALARAYSSGDFTVVYPVARSLPVLMVGVGDMVRRQMPTPIGWLGMTLVAMACLFVPLHSLKEIRAKLYFNKTVGWALLTAVATTGYSLTDKFAIEAVSRGPLSAAVYGYAFYSFATIVFFFLVTIFGRKGEDRASVGWLKPALAGSLTFGSYGLILWAYQYVGQAGYVVAFRQFSILIGVVIAILWFREKGALIRITAACLMVLGLVLIGVYGKAVG